MIASCVVSAMFFEELVEQHRVHRLVPHGIDLPLVVAADCYSDAHFSRRVRCLYVLEKHGSKWKVTHHYSHGLPAIVRSNQSLEATADRYEVHV